MDKRLRTLLSSGRMGAPLLFTGPAGVGKRTAALELAKTLNCEGEIAPCDACRSCRKIAAGIHPDVQMIDFSHQARFFDEAMEDQRSLRIEMVQAMKRTLAQKPFEGRWKVTIIDEAHHLTSDASNTLLKLLEEPPPRTLVILLTDHRDQLLSTIRSRCQTVQFRGTPVEEKPSEPLKQAEHLWDQLAPLTPPKWLTLRRQWDHPGKAQRQVAEDLLQALLAVGRQRLPAEDRRLPEVLRAVLDALTAIRQNSHPRIVWDALSLQLHEILRYDPYLLRQ
ncbi:MAG: AAA family ATPase [Elusimicrobia bacterium]|nr:AAA family ATPase [Elusimicrobiota bacterium]